MADIYTLVTDRIINLIETGRFPDVACPWNQERTTTIPYNAFSGRPFNGINVTLLWAQAIGWGYREDRWLTVRPGSRSRWIGTQR